MFNARFLVAACSLLLTFGGLAVVPSEASAALARPLTGVTLAIGAAVHPSAEVWQTGKAYTVLKTLMVSASPKPQTMYT